MRFESDEGVSKRLLGGLAWIPFVYDGGVEVLWSGIANQDAVFSCGSRCWA
jgi:hypothetical protein